MLDRISRDHVERALAAIRKDGVPASRRSTKFCLVVDRVHFAPKYVLAMAARHAFGRALRPDEFSGGPQTNTLLESLGYDVVACACGGEGGLVISNPPGPPMPTAAATPRTTSTGAPSDGESTPIVRIVSNGRTSDDVGHVRRQLLEALTKRWPRGVRATFAVTPGGFVRTKWPAGVHLTTGWNSTGKSVRTIIDHAARALDKLLTREIVNAAAARTQFLTIGIDVV